MIYERALAERDRLEREVKKLKKELKKYPEGKLVYSSSGKYVKYYISDGHDKEYIPANQREIAEEMAMKRYITTLIDEYSNEIISLNFYINHHQKHTMSADDWLSDLSKYQDLISSQFKPSSKKLKEWVEAKYETNSEYPEQLINKGLSGHMVRSKSEATIDLFLTQNHIPFRYECKLDLGEGVYYPDFTILHPKTLKIYYWEHFGMMDNEKYRKKVNDKLKVYNRNGIIQSVNLITTYETAEKPLTPEYVKMMVEYYFL